MRAVAPAGRSGLPEAATDDGAEAVLVLCAPGAQPLTLRPGRLARLVGPATALADAVLGLEEDPDPAVPPLSVRFMGQDWAALDPGAQARLRRRAGRVFAGTGWLSNLDVDENVLLACHGEAPENLPARRRRADVLARRLGLNGLPRTRPAQTPGHELQLCQWVRALVPEPRLLILEHPTRGCHRWIYPTLAALLEQLLAEGVAVLWLEDDAHTPDTLGLRPDLTLHLGTPGG